MMNSLTDRTSVARRRTPLNRSQIAGFWGAWAGWTLDGMDSFIYALVLTPALTELLPRSGYAATPANVGLAGSILFALFLVGWGLSFIWGPLADRFGRTKVLAGTIFTFAIFTGLAATSHNVWELAIYRFIAGVGIGGEWALAGTYVAESWPEDRRKMGAGYLQTGYYAGFFLAAALNYTIGVHFGWRAMFLTGAVPVVVAILVLLRVKETEKWQKAEAGTVPVKPLREILGPHVGRVHSADHRNCWFVGGRGVRAIGRNSTGDEGRHGEERCDQDGVARDRLAVDCDDTRLSRVAADGRADRPQKDVGDLLHWHGGGDCRQFRLGVLSAERARAVYRMAFRAGFLRR
jgi:hypothetical protein